MGLPEEKWRERYTNPRMIELVEELFKDFYNSLGKDGHLTLTGLAKLYDGLGIREPLLDGNGRAQVLALSHVLLSNGFDTPDMTNVHKGTINELRQKFPDAIERNIQFLKMVLPEKNRPPDK